MLLVVESLLNLKLTHLITAPVREVEILFEDSAVLNFRRLGESRASTETFSISLDGRHNARWEFTPQELHRLEDWADDVSLRQRQRVNGERIWKVGGDFYSLDQMLNYALKIDANNRRLGLSEDVVRLKQYLGDEPCLMVSTHRVDQINHRVLSMGQNGELNAYSNSFDHPDRFISREIAEARLDYSRKSQKLDSSFPARLLNRSEDGSSNIFRTEDMVRDFYRDIREMTVQMAGAVGIETVEMLELPDRDLEEWEIQVLGLQLTDQIEKIQSLRPISQRIKQFEAQVNRKLVRSQIRVDTRGLRLETGVRDGAPPRIADLSSGEQHQIQMAFDLVFRSRDKNLVLIDEPEISLHVDWQNNLLDEFGLLAELNELQFLIATHSPEIIGNAWMDVTALQLRLSLIHISEPTRRS